jgi:hypothetical protein
MKDTYGRGRASFLKSCVDNELRRVFRLRALRRVASQRGRHQTCQPSQGEYTLAFPGRNDHYIPGQILTTRTVGFATASTLVM